MSEKLSMRYSRTDPPPGVRYDVHCFIGSSYPAISRFECVRRWFIIQHHSACAVICGYFTDHKANYMGAKYPVTGQTWNCWCGQFNTNVYEHKPYRWREKVQ